MANARKNEIASYTEAQSKSWLSWLARGMQAHGQTVFMIEQLQPSWLPTRRQLTVYVFTSRLLAGLVYGLFVGIGSAWLFSGTYAEMTVFTFHGLLCGFIFGMTIACIDLYRFNRRGRNLQQREEPTRWQYMEKELRVLFLVVVFGLTAFVTLVLHFIIIELSSSLTQKSVSFGIAPQRWYWIVTIGLISVVFYIGITSVALVAGSLFVNYVLNLFRGGIKQEPRYLPIRRHLASVLFVGMVIFFYVAPIWLVVLSAPDLTLLRGSDAVFNFWLARFFVLAVILSFICGMRQRKVEYDIQTVETLNWSWARSRKGVLIGALCLMGLVGVLSAMLLGEEALQATPELIVGLLLIALFCGLIFGIFLATIGGIQQGVAEMKTSPNQGILLSMRSAAFMSVVCGLIVAIVSMIIFPIFLGYSVLAAPIYGIIIALFAGSWFGGLDVLNHYLLRWLLYRFGHTPLNYVHFLDYAAKDLNFLQKVGGGYIFIHRTLLEHFAAMENEGILKPQETLTLPQPMLSESASGQ